MASKRLVLQLRTKITLLVCVVVALALLAANAVISGQVEQETQKSLAEKATDIARIVARSAVVIEGLTGQRRADDVQAFTEDIRQATNVEFIVVLNMNGIRLSHPESSRIGQHFVGGDEGAVLTGKEYISEATGTLGPSLRAFTPVLAPDGRQVGAVSVGILLDKIQQTVQQSHQGLYLAVFIGLLVGVAGAVLLAGNIKRTLFGLEPSAFARVLQERVAMLQSVREGIIAVDKDSRITLVNGEGLRLLARAGIKGEPLGQAVESFVPNTRLQDVLSTGLPELEQEQDLNGVILLTNRVPVLVDGEIVGAIATFRDKTEVKRLAEQLTGVRDYAEALRSQAHEFMNKLHVIMGMVQLACYDQLTHYINGIAKQYQREVGFVARRIKDPVLAGFLLGKLSRAREAGVDLRLAADGCLPASSDAAVVHELVTIIGNLVDNALEAVADSAVKRVDIRISCQDDVLCLAVSDTGPGIASEQQDNIFVKGYSTKAADRGMGLYLVANSLHKLGGNITITEAGTGGAEFTVTVPYCCEDESDD